MQQLNFEVLLNPSVATADDLRLSRQARAMYRLFSEGRSVSNVQLAQIGRQYGARLYELRRALIPLGWCIDVVGKGGNGVCFYRLVRIEESSFYREHQGSL
jgi:hypothetical protein